MRPLCLALSFALLTSAWSTGAAQEKPQPVAGVSLSSDMLVCRSFADFGCTVRCIRDNYTGKKIHSAEYELRRVGDDTRVIRWAYLHELDETFDDARPARWKGSYGGFYERILRRLGEAPPGEYRLAFLLNGERCSRVVAFTIDPNFDIHKAPVFQFSALEPHPYEKLTIPMLNIIGPTPADEKFTTLTAYTNPLIIDGNTHKKEAFVVLGSHGPIQSGHRYTQAIHLQEYHPKVDPAAKHVFLFRFGGHESKPFTLDPSDQPLNREWDARTPRMKNPPSKQPILHGTITDANGKPAVGYEVIVKTKTGSQRDVSEITDQQGHYSFVNIPDGIFWVIVSPQPDPGATIIPGRYVELVRGKPTVCDMDFRNRYQVEGKVVDHSGKPVGGVAIAATWKNTKTNAEFTAETLSIKDGTYLMDGPYRKIIYIAVNDGGKSGAKPRHNLKPREQVDFVVKRPPTK